MFEGREQPGSVQGSTSSSHQLLCSSVSLPRVKKPGLTVYFTTVAFMGCWQTFFMVLTLSLGQSQFQGGRQETHPLICPKINSRDKHFLPFDEEMRGQSLLEACRGQRHDTFPLLSYPGVPRSSSWVRKWNFSRGRAASALPIQHLCLASVLGSISLHSQL
jgi:hypothetical protein